MRILSVVGARPQFVKLAPVERAIKSLGMEHVTAHTGQHYDEAMSDRIFEALDIAAPTWNLGIGSGNHGKQTAAMLEALEEVLLNDSPDAVLVYGDTNSTLAAALAAVKLHIPLVHLEAGLRSFNRKMPEEHNRVLVDHAADLCLAPTQLAIENLKTEGLVTRSALVGDVMVDILLDVAARDQPARLSEVFRTHDLSADRPYILATIHRAENTDSLDRLRSIISALQGLDVPVILPVHPRVRAIANGNNIELNAGCLHVVEPLDYIEMVHAVANATSVITDSGGLQKEAFVLGVPTTTVRTETEWPETLVNSWNVLTPAPVAIKDSVTRNAPTGARDTPYGTGDASERVAEVIRRTFG